MTIDYNTLLDLAGADGFPVIIIHNSNNSNPSNYSNYSNEK